MRPRRDVADQSLVSLAERMAYLQMLRAAFAAAVIAFGALAGHDTIARLPSLLLLTAAYLAATAGTEAYRRLSRRAGLVLVGGMLLVDGAYLAWAMYETGGSASPLRLLVYVHLIAVTLLASYRSGLKIALWHSLLFFSTRYAETSGLIASPPVDRGIDTNAPVVFTAFWILALASAAFSAVNERELRRRKRDVELLNEMATGLEHASTPEDVARCLLDSVIEAFEFKRGVVLAGEDGELKTMAYRGPGEPAEVRPGRDAVVDQAWNEHQPVLIGRLGEEDSRLSLLLPMARNLVVVPLSTESHPIGALVLEHGHEKIERRLVSLLTQFGSHASLALRNAWLAAKVQRLADTDSLTGLANRRTFAQTLEKEVSRAIRNREPVTLAMIDVDHFKKINDVHGHPAGDDVLRRVAAALRDACRDFDTPARYGGEEFAVILPSCTSKESMQVVERLRTSIAEIGTDFRVTASAGTATFPTHATSGDALIRAADHALYESKSSGRNRSTRSRRRPRGSRVEVAVGAE